MVIEIGAAVLFAACVFGLAKSIKEAQLSVETEREAREESVRDSENEINEMPQTGVSESVGRRFILGSRVAGWAPKYSDPGHWRAAAWARKIVLRATRSTLRNSDTPPTAKAEGSRACEGGSQPGTIPPGWGTDINIETERWTRG